MTENKRRKERSLRLNFPSLYIQFLIYFHANRDYFECHEVLEEHWKKNGMERDSVWVGFIQMAVSFYHYRRQNLRGALKMMDKTLRNLSSKRKEIHRLGMHHSELIHLLNDCFEQMNKDRKYEGIHLPIVDSALLVFCKKQARQNGYKWGRIDDATDQYIVHKHFLRNCFEQSAETKNDRRSQK